MGGFQRDKKMSLLEWIRKNRPNDLKVRDYIAPKKRNYIKIISGITEKENELSLEKLESKN